MNVSLPLQTANEAIGVIDWAVREFKQIAELMDEEGIPRTLEDGSKLTQAQRVEMYVKGHRASRVTQYYNEKEKMI